MLLPHFVCGEMFAALVDNLSIHDVAVTPQV
jgi:hypothetical protein